MQNSSVPFKPEKVPNSSSSQNGERAQNAQTENSEPVVGQNVTVANSAATQENGPTDSKASGAAMGSFEGYMQSLIDEKYNREYKLDRKTRVKAIEILRDYYAKNQCEANMEDDIMVHTTIRAAILIASKCQVYPTKDGQLVRGCGLSTSTFLRGRPQIPIEEFQKKLQQVRLEANLEQIVIQECVKVQNKIGLNLNFYEKFCKVWDSLGIRDRSLGVSAAHNIKKLTWLMFVTGKVKILQGREDITEMAFLLFACIYWAVMLSPADIHSDVMDELKKSVAEEQKSQADRLALLDIKVRDHLSQILKAQESIEQIEPMIGSLRDLLLKMKAKGRLQGFSNLDDEIDLQNNINVPSHLSMTYEGICDETNQAEDKFCQIKPSKCLHGIFDQGNLNKNIRTFDQYYAKQMYFGVDFDERFFINANGLQHTPIKLVSPGCNYANNKVVGGAATLQQNSSNAGHKSPLSRSSLSNNMAKKQYNSSKRARTDHQVPLKFVSPPEVPQQHLFQQQPSSMHENSNNEASQSQSHQNQHVFGITGSKESAQPMQRRLEFSQTLQEMSLREQLNMRAFPQLAPSQSPMIDYHGNITSPNPNLQTPIGQMMALKHWVDELQRQVPLDPETGFLQSLPEFFRLPSDQQEHSESSRAQMVQCGQSIRSDIQNGMLTKIFQKLQERGVIERPHDQYFSHNKSFEQRHSEPIYKICCSLMEKTLNKELRRCRLMNKEMPMLVKNDTFQKSFLIYACLIHFYSKNINDISVQELLEELELHAFELWLTFQTFIQLDPNLPRQLREHFLDIERQLTLHLIWQKNTIVVKKLQSVIAKNDLEEQLKGDEEGKIKQAVAQQETFAQVHAKEQAEEKALAQFKMFFNRVKQIAANTIQEMCEHLKISEECREFIWNILLVTLGLKSNLLFGRHLDQLIMCAIYGVCKIHQGNKTIQVLQKNASYGQQGIKFQDIINSYKEIHKYRLQKSGRWQVNISQSNSVSWVYIEVPLNPGDENSQKIDIIKFYNDVYLEKMKQHILKTKSLTLEQGSKTPVLNQSNFDALLTPGGRKFKPVINHFTKLTPLIDSLGKHKRFSAVTYMNRTGGTQLVNTAGVLATPALGSQPHGNNNFNNLPFLTPRTSALYATNERQFNTSTDQMLMVDTSNAKQMAKTYANIPVHKLAAHMRQNDGESGQLQPNSRPASGVGSFVNLAAHHQQDSNRPAQPKIQMMGKVATNLTQMKAPATIAERPAAEEQDNSGIGGNGAVRLIQNHQSFKLERDQSPNSIVGKNFYIKTNILENDEGGHAQDSSIYEEKHEDEDEDGVRGKENDNVEDDERISETKKPVNLATISAVHRQSQQPEFAAGLPNLQKSTTICDLDGENDRDDKE